MSFYKGDIRVADLWMSDRFLSWLLKFCSEKFVPELLDCCYSMDFSCLNSVHLDILLLWSIVHFIRAAFWSKSLLKLYFHFIIWHLNSARLFYNSDSPRSFPRDPLETVASPARTVYPVLRWVPVKYTHWLAQYLIKRLLRVRKLKKKFPPSFCVSSPWTREKVPVDEQFVKYPQPNNHDTSHFTLIPLLPHSDACFELNAFDLLLWD